MRTEPRLIEVRKNVLKQNDVVARNLRERFRAAGVFVVSLVSSPGSGKTAFLDIRDLSGTIQAVVRVDALGQETYDRILNLDIGDIVGVEGCVYVTQRGQLALEAVECTLLTKTLLASLRYSPKT